MSLINGLGGPRLSTPTPSTSTARGPASTSFLSRVQAGVTGASQPKASTGTGVSGRDVVSSAVDAAKQAVNGEATDPAKKTIQDMSRHFVMGLAQGIFGDMGQIAPKLDQD